MKKAAIIIVNWNGKKFLKNCLDSVYNQSYKKFDIYFVDNGSKDKSVEYVKKNWKKTKIISLNQNLGFAGGNNVGIKECLKDPEVAYVVCLNNDTIVDKNWLRNLIITAEKDDKIGIIQSKILFGDRKHIHSTGATLNFDFSSNSRGYNEIDKGEYQDSDIQMAIGCSMLIKKEVIKQIGMFEEKFGSYKEDDDLSLRARMSNFTIRYSSKSIVYHFHSQTLKARSPKKVFLNERNRLYNLITYGNIYQILFSWVYTIKRFLGSSKTIKKNEIKENKLLLIIALIKAHMSVIPNIKYFIKKRIKFKELRKNEI